MENSSFVTLDGGNANLNGAGIGRGAVGTINKNFIGAIDIENSNNITVKGWQMLADHNGNVWTGNTFKKIDSCITQQ